METMEKHICIKCHATALDEDSVFCYNCGYPLNSNYCTNEVSCDYNNGQQIPLPEFACYCDSCGSETSYFQEKLIQPSENPQNEHTFN